MEPWDGVTKKGRESASVRYQSICTEKHEGDEYCEKTVEVDLAGFDRFEDGLVGVQDADAAGTLDRMESWGWDWNLPSGGGDDLNSPSLATQLPSTECELAIPTLTWSTLVFFSPLYTHLHIMAAPSKSSSILRRALLYVPASSPRMLAKSLKLSACDNVTYDLEDSVTPAQKPAAREAVRAPPLFSPSSGGG